MRAQGIFLNYIEEWARLLFLLQILGFSLSFFTKIALFMFYYKYRYGLIFEVICVKMRIMRAKKYDILVEKLLPL